MRVHRLAGVVVVCALMAGCEDSKVAEVTGTVTVDGEPVAAGSITFFPADGQAPTAGTQITDGKYTAKVPIGVMKVSISYPKVAGTKKLYPTPDSPVGTLWKEGLPAKYNEQSELTFEVKPGKNTKDWELAGK
jgi:hypothetical protein